MSIILVDFGSQYTKLLFHKLTFDLCIETILLDYKNFNNFTKELLEKEYKDLKAIILSGGPDSVNNENSPKVNFSTINNYHILGICYGGQLIAKEYGCSLNNIDKSEFGLSNIMINNNIYNFSISSAQDICLQYLNLVSNIPRKFNVWMSHNDYIDNLSDDLFLVAVSNNNTPAIWKVKNSNKEIIGIQYHLEVSNTEYGMDLLKNFITLSGIEFNVRNNSLFDNINLNIKEIVNDEHVICALSGGVDSSTLAFLLANNIHDHLHAIIIDNGLMRKDEIINIVENYKGTILEDKIVICNAQEVFLKRLENVTNPEEKRKIIGKTFIDVLVDKSKEIEESINQKIKFLAQGTIYPDIIESGKIKGSKVIKSHHNVGGLPDDLPFTLLEPLKNLFKDNVRDLAKQLNIPKIIYNRHPFPGPGLAIRILGDITYEKIKIIRECDNILLTELKNNDCYNLVWQAAAILLPIKTVGVMGDERTYNNVVALRLVNSVNGMTASVCKIPIEVLTKISDKIVNTVKHVNRVVYDLTSKPPGTIEWE